MIVWTMIGNRHTSFTGLRKMRRMKRKRRRRGRKRRRDLGTGFQLVLGYRTFPLKTQVCCLGGAPGFVPEPRCSGLGSGRKFMEASHLTT